MLDTGDLIPDGFPSLFCDEFAPGVFGDWPCCSTFEKKREDRLRGGSNGASRPSISMQAA